MLLACSPSRARRRLFGSLALAVVAGRIVMAEDGSSSSSNGGLADDLEEESMRIDMLLTHGYVLGPGS